MTERSVGTLRALDASTIDRLFAEAAKGAAFEAQMRGIDVMGMDAQGRFVVTHPDGATSPFPRA